MKNEIFRSIVCKTSCKLPPTDKYTNDDREFNTTNECWYDVKLNKTDIKSLKNLVKTDSEKESGVGNHRPYLQS